MKILREPLLHFLVLGAAVFLLFRLLRDPAEVQAGSSRIVISAGDIQSLLEIFQRTWQRPPQPEELKGLIDDRVLEEVYAREALAMGLDRDDTIIRRRLRQKMEFLAEDLTRALAPSEAELAAFLAANPEKFRLDSRISFEQVFLDRERRGDAIESDARALLAQLEASPAASDANEPGNLGDSFLLDSRYEDEPEAEIAQLFGQEFAARLRGIEPGRWQGPIESGYGLHLVLVRERTEGRLPELAEVRDAVEREWSAVQRREAKAAFEKALLERYTVEVEMPAPASTAAESPVVSVQ